MTNNNLIECYSVSVAPEDESFEIHCEALGYMFLSENVKTEISSARIEVFKMRKALVECIEHYGLPDLETVKQKWLQNQNRSINFNHTKTLVSEFTLIEIELNLSDGLNNIGPTILSFVNELNVDLQKDSIQVLAPLLDEYFDHVWEEDHFEGVASIRVRAFLDYLAIQRGEKPLFGRLYLRDKALVDIDEEEILSMTSHYLFEVGGKGYLFFYGDKLGAYKPIL